MQNTSNHHIDYNELINICIHTAFDAGNEIMYFYQSGYDVETKSDNSPLTSADKAANAVIVEALKKTGIPILSEEEKAIPFETRKSWEYLWIVDPLDGTKEFIKHNDEFTVNIALIHNGTPVLGVVYCPPLRTFYFGSTLHGAYKAVVGKDAKVDAGKLTASATKLPVQQPQRKFKVVASRSHMNAETADYIEKLKKLHGEIALISKGSSLKLCEVAEGSADIYPRFAPTSEWDTAAAHAVVKAAGGEVIDPATNHPLHYNKADILNPWFIVKGKK
jgi:3'(2'), 5'-bisphosphate nucleotidase